MDDGSAPAFSVIVPAYNAAATLAPTLRSVLAQSRPDFEIVVVDDGSTDATADIAAGFLDDRRVRLVRQANRGLAGARNAGIDASRAPLVCLLDSDDLWLPHYLASIGALLEAHPEAAFATCDAWLLDDGTGRVRRATVVEYQGADGPLPDRPDDLLRVLLRGNVVYGGATIRRAALDRAGGFDARLRAAEDFELWLRFAAHGLTGVRHPDRLAVYRLRAASLSRQQEVMHRNLRDVYRTVEREYDVTPEIRADAAARAAAHERQLLAGRHRAAGPAVRAVRRARRQLGAARERAAADRVWHDRTPPEVSALLTATGA